MFIVYLDLFCEKHITRVYNFFIEITNDMYIILF